MLAIVSKKHVGARSFCSFGANRKKVPAEAAPQRRASSGGGHARRIEWIQGVLRATKARCAPSAAHGASNSPALPPRPPPPQTLHKPRVPFVDLYEVLALKPSATDGEVKNRVSHLAEGCPSRPRGRIRIAAAAALVNEAASVLTSPTDRARFDRDRSEWLASGRGSSDQSLMDPSPLSAWSGPSEGEPEDDRGRHDAAFVDESACIGCLKCALIAPTTILIETRFGCARRWINGRMGGKQ